MSRRPLKIAIASAGRFHVLDLARELHALGHEVRFHSYVPRRRAERFGLPGECQRPVTARLAPLLAWQRLAPRLAPENRDRWINSTLDRAVAARLTPCDVFIFMSGIFLDAARAAKRRYGARLWLERGSAHIAVQDEILARIPGAARPSAGTLARELAGYALTDRIVVPSAFAARTFVGHEASKLFLNPYGVDLEQFPMVERPRREGPLRLLFVGNWSTQKACDLLAPAIRAVPGGATITHVGPITDAPFPSDDARFRHFGQVDQPQLAAYYAEADALVLPSRQDGFGLVIAQALATGLPVICSDHTGGPDLARTSALAARIVVAPAGDAPALTAAIIETGRRLSAGLPPLTADDRESLSWRAYGARYAAEIARDVFGDAAT